jgi:ribose 5-phosphate isomerase B
MSCTIAIASDHAGIELKKILIPEIAGLGHQAVDLGTHTTESVDYPDFADAACKKILSGEAKWGVIICGSGIGIAIAANRHKGIRAAVCHSGLGAELSRRHNDANILALGARLIGVEEAKECLRRFLSTEFEGGRHAKRIQKMG